MKKRPPIVLTTEENSLLAIHQGLVKSFNQKIMEASSIVQDVIHYYQSIILCMPGNVFWMDSNCRTIGCNQNVLDMFGLQKIQDFQGLSFEDMAKLGRWTNNQMESFKKDTLEVIETGCMKANVEEPPIPGADGKDIYFLTTRVPLFNNKNKVVGMVGISTDITAKKIAEEKEKLLITQTAEAQGQAKAEIQMRQALMVLTGSIVHDLRTPLASFKISSNYLKKVFPELIALYQLEEKPSIAHVTNALNNLEKSVLQMSEFIDSTLKTLSKSVSGQLGPEDLFLCSMHKCVTSMLNNYPFAAGERALVEWAGAPDYEFKGNEVLMLRILCNLMKNALYQVSKNNHGKVIISTEQTNKYNILRFRDTAGGAEPEVVARLFAGYETTKKEGTGVGLAYCKQVMRSFGGDISCHSEYGNYIEFVMTFPIV